MDFVVKNLGKTGFGLVKEALWLLMMRWKKGD
jgi:hypothetical protein